MGRPGAGPLDALRACCGLAFWPLEQRLAAKAVSRRWRDVACDPDLWAELEMPATLLGLLPTLLRRHGASLRQLTVTAPFAGASGRAFAGLPCGLADCNRLVHISIRSLSGPELTRCRLVVPSVRVLALGYMPYFILSNYSHNTGAPAATVPMDWVARTFPSLEDLSCDYLQVDEAVAAPLPLRALALVAVVRESEEHALWGSEHCCRDLAAVARVAPRLERLRWRDPRPHLGRMSWRPSQSAEDLCWLCRRFCALETSQLRGIRRLLPALRNLEVATLKEDSDPSLEGLDLADYLGLGDSPGSCTAADGGAVADGACLGSAASGGGAQLRLQLGGISPQVAGRWQAAAEKSRPGLVVEVGDPPPEGPSRSRTLLQTMAEAALRSASVAHVFRHQFPSGLWDSEEEESSADVASSVGDVVGSPVASSADSGQPDSAQDGVDIVAGEIIVTAVGGSTGTVAAAHSGPPAPSS
mmetsp:Transcript_41280/g.131268  ORF Transcript_41280/g.131268 Transcript_41280/m.131268 type:complete len:471 (-) Transcript_41280:160-1572(-)